MTEQKPLGFEGLVATAKTGQEIHLKIESAYDGGMSVSEYDEAMTEKWVSLGDLQRTFFAERTSIKKQFDVLYKKIGEYSVDATSQRDMRHFDKLGLMLDELAKKVFSAGFSPEESAGKREDDKP